MSNNKILVYHHSTMWYHIILFVSFIAAVLIIPFAQDFLSNYLDYKWLVVALSYLFSYAFAIYLFPELGFLIYKMSVKTSGV